MAVTPFQQKRIDQQREASHKAAEAQRLSAESRRRQEENDKEQLNRLDKIVENSSEKNRNFFAAYLGLLIYVQAIVFSTTDLQLLYSVDGLKLPIIDLTVPLVGFYVVIPFFIIALHFNFLQNLESHHNKLMRWQEAHPDGKVPRTSIRPFLFDYAVLEKEGQMARLVRWANSLLCFNFAPITLGLLLIRYSDSQDWPVTLFHYLAFVFDVWLVWKLRLALKDNANAQTATPTIPTVRGFIRDIPGAGLRGGFGLLLLTVTLATVLIGGTSDDYFVTHVQPLVQPITQVSSELNDWNPLERGWQGNKLIKNNIQPLWQPTIKIIARPLEWLLPRIAINPTETVWQPDEKAIQTEAKLAHFKDDWAEYFDKHGKGLLPTPQSLRFVQLAQQNLRKAQLNNAKLQGANLGFAKLQGANFAEAKLQGAFLGFAKLQGAYLRGTELQGVNLLRAVLQGTDLGVAKLQGANLTAAKLQGSNLRGAKLQGAFLGWAELQGANLRVAKLQGAYLEDAKLQGANLREAELQGANFAEAKLQGAFFCSTKIVGIEYPSKATVFNVVSLIDKPSTLFDETLMGSNDWKELEAVAKDITDEAARKEYKARIKRALDHPSYEVTQVWLSDNSPTHVQKVVTELCQVSSGDQPSRLAAVQGFRNNFNKQLDRSEELQNNSKYQKLLNTLDITLCTLEACKDLRDGIEGLDCKTAAK